VAPLLPSFDRYCKFEGTASSLAGTPEIDTNFDAVVVDIDLLNRTQRHKDTKGYEEGKEGSTPKRKDGLSWILDGNTEPFFVALWLCVRKIPGVFYTFAARIMPPAVA